MVSADSSAGKKRQGRRREIEKKKGMNIIGRTALHQMLEQATAEKGIMGEKRRREGGGAGNVERKRN